MRYCGSVAEDPGAFGVEPIIVRARLRRRSASHSLTYVPPGVQSGHVMDEMTLVVPIDCYESIDNCGLD
jgi:hypothetical protein